MKTHIKAIAVMLATGAVCQAVYAYANQPAVSSDGVPVGFSECSDLREKMAALLERERERNRFEAQWGNPEATSDKRLNSILSELESMLNHAHEKVEPGP